MENIKEDHHPDHLTNDEYKAILEFIHKATEKEILEFLDIIKVKFSGGNEGLDKEQVEFVVASDTKNPEIKAAMLEYVYSK